MNSLFVYGTLRPNEPNAHILEKIGGIWKKGFVIGNLVESGWGAALGSPGIEVRCDGQKVYGYLFISDHLDEHWSWLDAFEGKEYQRTIVDVFLDDGEVFQSQIYAVRNSQF